MSKAKKVSEQSPNPAKTTPQPDTIEAFLEVQKGEGPGLSPSILDRFKADDLPAEYVIESMAAELLEHKASFQKADVAWRAAKHTDHQREQQMWSLRNYSRLCAAIIMDKWPKAVTLANEIAQVRVIQARQARRTMLEQEDEESGIAEGSPTSV